MTKIQSLLEQRIKQLDVSKTPEQAIERLLNDMDDNKALRKSLNKDMLAAKMTKEIEDARKAIADAEEEEDSIEKQIQHFQDAIVARDLDSQWIDLNNNLASRLDSPKRGKEHLDSNTNLAKAKIKLNEAAKLIGGNEEDGGRFQCRFRDDDTKERCAKIFGNTSNRRRHESRYHKGGIMISLH